MATVSPQKVLILTADFDHGPGHDPQGASSLAPSAKSDQGNDPWIHPEHCVLTKQPWGDVKPIPSSKMPSKAWLSIGLNHIWEFNTLSLDRFYLFLFAGIQGFCCHPRCAESNSMGLMNHPTWGI